MLPRIQIEAVRNRVVFVAKKNIGFGETTANNQGVFIELIGGNPGMEWCALFAGHCYRRAYQLEKLTVPDWLYRPPITPARRVAEPGALRLYQAMLEYEHGREIDLVDAIPGDLVLVKRVGGHHIYPIEFVEDGLVHSIEGNVGRFPAKVKRLVHDLNRDPNFKGICGLRS